jgi:hypothetical protein
MRRSWIVLVSLAVLLTARVGQAQQVQQPQLRGYNPPYTAPYNNGNMGWAPWLNLLNNTGFSGTGNGANNFGFGSGGYPGAGLAIQYFGIVRPEQQTMQNIGQIQSQVNTLQMHSQVAPPRNQGIADTGVPSRFMTYSAYFGNVMTPRTSNGR